MDSQETKDVQYDVAISKDQNGYTLIELITVVFIFIFLSAIAIPKYVDLRAKIKTNICKANQMAIETAVALAYADSLLKGSDRFPRRIVPAMFKNGKVPVCPEDGRRYGYSRRRQRAYCRTKNRRIRRRHNRRR
ncbi:MAG: type II secretion system protein [bacterium]